jgi:hypothetical protein
MLTQDYLKTFVHYDPETGIFTWIKNPSKNSGWIDCNGYIRIEISCKKYMAHRLAWLYMTGSFPKKHIDHINGIPSDNRLINLRECNQSENMQNLKKAQINNKSGFLGVSFYKPFNKFMSRICINKKQKFLGYFDTPEEAHEKYLEAKRKLHLFNTI